MNEYVNDKINEWCGEEVGTQSKVVNQGRHQWKWGSG